MNIHAAYLFGGLAATCMALIWGMHIGTNDSRALAQYDARAEMQARGVCGARAQLVRADGQYLCLYTNTDGSSITRSVFDYPLGVAAK